MKRILKGWALAGAVAVGGLSGASLAQAGPPPAPPLPPSAPHWPYPSPTGGHYPYPLPRPAPPIQRQRWNYQGGYFEQVDQSSWIERQAGYSRNYRELARTDKYVELVATDGSGIEFRLYDNRCEWRTPRTNGRWEYRAPGSFANLPATTPTLPPSPGGGGQSPAQTGYVPQLNDRVLRFSRVNLGQTIGNGECWPLVFEALRAAGARLPGQDGRDPYDFGQLVYAQPGSTPADYMRPGDIVQFEGVQFSYLDDSRYNMPHHTAIVAGANGYQVTLVHQNFGSRTVTQIALDFSKITQGSYRVYHPQPLQ